MRASVLLSVLLGVAVAACRHNAEKPAPLPTPPLRGAAGSTDLRIMAAELVSARVCDMIRGHFQALYAPGRPEAVTGVLWVRQCTSSSDGTRLRFDLAGEGWQWVKEKKGGGGATFAVEQYVRFRLTASVWGEIDVAYDQSSHVASLWFSPVAEPNVTFATIGGVEVDPEGVWSSVLGAVSSLAASSPEEQAKKQATAEGMREMKRKFAQGISITVNLCTGLIRSGFGRNVKGTMRPPGVGESRQIWVELEPRGVMIIGPVNAPTAMTVDVAVSKGAVQVALVCNDEAETVAQAFMQGRELPVVPELASRDVRDHATLAARSPNCPVSLVARALPMQDVVRPVAVFSWRRAPGESALSTGGPIIRCGTASR
jgi:hypothetical protein